MLDLHAVRIFLAAAETGNFSEAARRLQISQPAVSMQIRSLEEALGVALFHRAGRSVQLTDIGEALIPVARDLVNRARHAEELAASLQGEVIGMLHIACSTSVGKYIMPRLLASFLREYPSVRITCDIVSRGVALAMLLDSEAHIGITSLREPSRELDYRPLATDPVVLIVPPDHPWAVRDDIAPDELSETRFILREVGSGTREAVKGALAEHGIGLNDLNVVMTISNTESMYMGVTEGIGAAFISRRAAARGLAAGEVVEVPVRGLHIEQQLYLVRHATRIPTSAQAAFWSYVYAPAHEALLAQV